MCGIAGIVSLDGSHVEPQAVKAMSDTISHRGPDDAGYVFFRLSQSLSPIGPGPDSGRA